MRRNSTQPFFWNKLIALVEKLPGGLQKSIIRELTPVRELFFEQREARLVLLGSDGLPLRQLLESLSLPEKVVLPGPASKTDEIVWMTEAAGWQTFRHGARGQLLIFDARLSCSEATFQQVFLEALPDVVIFLQDSATEDGRKETESALRRLSLLREKGWSGTVVGIATSGDAKDVAMLREFLIRERQISASAPSVWPWLPYYFREITMAICTALPNSSRLEYARFSDAKEAQILIAESSLKSFAAICGIIGVQPIPLADMPILISIQTLMVGVIAYISGRSMDARTVAEFMGVLGINVGAGMLFREGARALVKVLPIWGYAVSGFVAGAGTYAIGKAAIAYFIEDRPATEARRIFHRLSRRKQKVLR